MKECAVCDDRLTRLHGEVDRSGSEPEVMVVSLDSLVKMLARPGNGVELRVA